MAEVSGAKTRLARGIDQMSDRVGSWFSVLSVKPKVKAEALTEEDYAAINRRFHELVIKDNLEYTPFELYMGIRWILSSASRVVSAEEEEKLREYILSANPDMTLHLPDEEPTQQAEET